MSQPLLNLIIRFLWIKLKIKAFQVGMGVILPLFLRHGCSFLIEITVLTCTQKRWYYTNYVVYLGQVHFLQQAFLKCWWKQYKYICESEKVNEQWISHMQWKLNQSMNKYLENNYSNIYLTRETWTFFLSTIRVFVMSIILQG